MPRLDAVTDDESKQIGTKNSQDAADGGADEPLQAYPAQFPFKENNGETDDRTHAGIPS